MANSIRTAEIYATAAVLGASAGPIIAHYAICLDTARLYRWIPGDASTADGEVILGYVGGTSGRWHMVRPDDRGADLTDVASATIYLSEKPKRYLPAGTLTANSALTIGTTTNSDASAALCADGDLLTITRLDVEAYTYAVSCAQLGAIITLPASEAWFVDLRFQDPGWHLLRAGKMTP